MRYLAAALAALLLGATPALAAGPDGPVKLTDAQLDQVQAAGFIRLNVPIRILLQNAKVNVNLKNSPVNIAASAQINLGGTAVQTATVSATQVIKVGP
jgi:hypothetical protein